MDGVLASSKEVVFDVIGEDVEHDDMISWNWPVEQFGADTFFGGFETAWIKHWPEIRPAENGLPGTVAELHDVFDVDVVTAQPDDQSIIDGKKAWLWNYGIPFDDLVTVPTDRSKSELGYRYYIDDKPSLTNEVGSGQTMYLRDQPYNQNATGDYHRVSSVAEVLERQVLTA